MTYLLYRHKNQKTLAFSVLLQYVLLKGVLFSRNENYCGYLQSFAYDYPVGIFTACYLESGDTYCSKLFGSTYEAHKKNTGKPPDEISLDKGYDEIEVREILEKDKTKSYICNPQMIMSYYPQIEMSYLRM